MSLLNPANHLFLPDLTFFWQINFAGKSFAEKSK